MNETERKLWINHHCDLFPEFRIWWQAHANGALRSIWADQLQRIDLLDAKAASSAMLSGEFDAAHPERWNFNALPRYICGVVRTIANQRIAAEAKAQQAQELEEQRLRRRHYETAKETLADKAIGREALATAERALRADEAFLERVRLAAMKFVRSKREDCNCRLDERSGYVRRYRWALTEADLAELNLIDGCKTKAIQ